MNLANISMASRLIDWAMRLMPPSRADWAQAMRREFDATPAADRLAFAQGCLWVAVKERIDPMQVCVTFARWSIAAVVAALVAVQFSSLVNLLSTPAQVAGRGILPMPWMALYLAGMVVGGGLAAIFLVWWRARPFMAGWAIVAITEAVFMTYLVSHAHLSLADYGFQFMPLILLANAAALLAWAANRTPRAPTAA
jgi:hypothetical protein